jgi:D-amino peptidase
MVCVKVFISFDMEGVAGIVDWSQCAPGGHGYAEGRALLLGEVNAAIDGALAGGATEVVCNDSHGTMNNLNPQDLHGRAAYIAGRHKPRYMMEGLDATFDAVFFVGYHGSISGESSVLSHTYNPAVVSRVRLNGVECGESGINALVALGHGVPVALVTGDQVTAAEAEPFMKEAEQVIVKGSIPQPARLDVDFQTADMALVASWVKGVERSGTRSVRIEGDDPLEVHRSFVGITYITRVSEGR